MTRLYNSLRAALGHKPFSRVDLLNFLKMSAIVFRSFQLDKQKAKKMLNYDLNNNLYRNRLVSFLLLSTKDQLFGLYKKRGLGGRE